MRREMNHFMGGTASLRNGRLILLLVLSFFSIVTLVSCAPEVNAAKRVNHVNASLETSLGVNHDGSFEKKDYAELNIKSITYTLTPLWASTATDASEDIYSELGRTRTISGDGLTEHISLGYLSQGYWELSVYAFDENGVLILSAVDVQYISENNRGFNIKFVGTSKPSEGSIHFEITVPVVAANMTSDARVRYVVRSVELEQDGDTPVFVESGVLNNTTPSDSDVVTFIGTTSSTDIPSGYYYVQTFFEEFRTGGNRNDNDDWMHAGGTTSKVYVGAATEISVTKNLKAADFISLGISVVPTEEISCTVTASKGENPVVGSSTSVTSGESLSFSVTSIPDATYQWYIDGGKVDNAAGDTLSSTFTSGYHSVTCVVIKGNSAASSSFYVTST